MNIKFKVSESSNFIHIMDSISGYAEESNCCDISLGVKEEYKRLFPRSKIDSGRMVVRGLTDRGYAVIYSNSRSAMSFGEDRLFGLFLSCENLEEAIERIKKTVPEHLLSSIRDPILHFRSNISKMYSRVEDLLEERRNNLERMLQNHPLDSLVGEVQCFYGSDYSPKQLSVDLLLNQDDTRKFAKVISKGRTILMPTALGVEENKHWLTDLGTVAHEIAHMIENSVLEKLLDFLKQKSIFGDEALIIREAIVESLVVYGVLGVKYGLVDKMLDKRVKIPSRYESPWEYIRSFRKKLGAYLCKSSSQALRDRKNIFEGNYLENAIDTLIRLRPN